MYNTSSSYSRPASVSQWHVHSRVMVFHILHIGQRDTRLCPLIIYRSLRCTLTLAPPQDSYFNYLHHSSTPSPSTVAAAASRAPARSIPTCSHHRISTCAPIALSNPSHRSSSERVAIYCATVFCCRLIYSYIVNNPASSISAAAKVYLVQHEKYNTESAAQKLQH